MTFRAIVPYEITNDNITATNIATEPGYSAGALYTFEESFILGADGLLYQYIGETGTTHQRPMTDGQTDWVLVGVRNSLRPFDIQRGVGQESVINTQAERNDSITYTLNGLGRVMAIGFINVEAVTITLTITETTTGDVLNQTYTLPDLANYGDSFYNFLYLPINRETELVITDLNVPPGCEFQITIENTGGVAKVGAIVMGLAQSLGEVKFEPSWELKSYSIYQADTYRRTLIRVPGGEAVSLEVVIPDGAARRIQKVLSEMDGTAALYQPSAQYPEFTIYGVFRGARQTAKGNGITFLNIKIEGL